MLTEEQLNKMIWQAVVDAIREVREQAEPAETREAQRPKYVIEWDEGIKAKFVEWMRADGRDESYIRRCVNYLYRYMRPVRSPADVVSMFAACKSSRQHLDRTSRNLLKFYRKIMGYPRTS